MLGGRYPPASKVYPANVQLISLRQASRELPRHEIEQIDALLEVGDSVIEGVPKLVDESESLSPVGKYIAN